jgi:hypothetical protein
MLEDKICAVVKPANLQESAHVDSGQVFGPRGLPTLPLISGKWIARAVNEFT